MIFRQIGGALVAVFIFFAIIAALSRLLTMKELPTYLNDFTSGIANLFNGAFGQ